MKRQYDLEVLNPHPDLDEIEVRLQKRTPIVFTYPDIKYEFRIVSVGSRKTIQKTVIRDGKTQYSNFWGWN